MLKYLLREEWGFNGFVVSDFGAISSVETEFDFQPPDGSDPIAYTFNAGCDQDGGDYIYDERSIYIHNGVNIYIYITE